MGHTPFWDIYCVQGIAVDSEYSKIYSMVKCEVLLIGSFHLPSLAGNHTHLAVTPQSPITLM